LEEEGAIGQRPGQEKGKMNNDCEEKRKWLNRE
jgi:hypothetical protein